MVFGKSKRTTPTNAQNESMLKHSIGDINFTPRQGKKIKFPMANVKKSTTRSLRKKSSARMSAPNLPIRFMQHENAKVNTMVRNHYKI